MSPVTDILAAALLLASTAHAFDRTAWLEKRAFFTAEAERLQQAYSNCAARVVTPAENAVVPLETFPDGSVKLSISARRAQFFLKEGLVWASGVTILRYAPDHTVDTRIDAHKCILDRETKNGWVEGGARFRHKQTDLVGTNVYFSASERYLMTLRGVRLDSRDFKVGGLF